MNPKPRSPTSRLIVPSSATSYSTFADALRNLRHRALVHRFVQQADGRWRVARQRIRQVSSRSSRPITGSRGTAMRSRWHQMRKGLAAGALLALAFFSAYLWADGRAAAPTRALPSLSASLTEPELERV